MGVAVDNIAKTYNRRVIFKNIYWQINKGESAVIAGANGTGKSTLLKIIAGLTRPRRGQVYWSIGGKKLNPSENRHQLGFVSPELQLYSELTALENMRFFALLRGMKHSSSTLKEHLNAFGLGQAAHWQVHTFSSGMKQRLKLAYALLHKPYVLLLDEPSTNLDALGRQLVHTIIKDQQKKGIVIIASNEEQEVAEYGQKTLWLGE